MTKLIVFLSAILRTRPTSHRVLRAVYLCVLCNAYSNQGLYFNTASTDLSGSIPFSVMYDLNTDMRRLTTVIRSEKCVVVRTSYSVLTRT